MPRLIARERFFYAGRNVEKGEEFEAHEQDVALLIHSVSPRAQAPDSDHPASPPRRRQYNRRDMRVEED